MHDSIARLTFVLRNGVAPKDYEFDLHLTPEARLASRGFWTPLAVALRAVQLLELQGVRRVLDVGSGPGKFCVVGALASSIHFSGIEQRSSLARSARELADKFGVSEQVTIFDGTIEQVDFKHFDGLYFFNPFGENWFSGDDCYDCTVELGELRFRRDVLHMEWVLANLPLGTCVATYHGFGGRIPDSYELLHSEEAGSDFLRLWRRVHPQGQGGYWVERDEVTLRHLGDLWGPSEGEVARGSITEANAPGSSLHRAGGRG